MNKDEMRASIVSERTGTSATDIVDRLRERAGQNDECDWHGAIECEAADEIERLRGKAKDSDDIANRVLTYNRNMCEAMSAPADLWASARELADDLRTKYGCIVDFTHTLINFAQRNQESVDKTLMRFAEKGQLDQHSSAYVKVAMDLRRAEKRIAELEEKK